MLEFVRDSSAFESVSVSEMELYTGFWQHRNYITLVVDVVFLELGSEMVRVNIRFGFGGLIVAGNIVVLMAWNKFELDLSVLMR